jgi:hypothetical protein
MSAAIAADLILLLHLAFILFVGLGGLLVLRWPRLAWLHLPAVAWGAAIELMGTVVCPLTPLENTLRRAGGQAGYGGSFMEYYILPLVYPPGLTRSIQIWIGIAVLAVNLVAYSLLLTRRNS